MGPADGGDTNTGMASNYDTESGSSHYGESNNNQFSTLPNCIVQFTWAQMIHVRVGKQNKLTSFYHFVKF